MTLITPKTNFIDLLSDLITYFHDELKWNDPDSPSLKRLKARCVEALRELEGGG